MFCIAFFVQILNELGLEKEKEWKDKDGNNEYWEKGTDSNSFFFCIIFSLSLPLFLLLSYCLSSCIAYLNTLILVNSVLFVVSMPFRMPCSAFFEHKLRIFDKSLAKWLMIIVKNCFNPSFVLFPLLCVIT